MLRPATRIPHQPNHNETSTHIETRTHNQCGDTIEKSQAPHDGCINFRNMFCIEEVEYNLINCDIKLVSYSSTITKMRGQMCIRFVSVSVNSSTITKMRGQMCIRFVRVSVNSSTITKMRGQMCIRFVRVSVNSSTITKMRGQMCVRFVSVSVNSSTITKMRGQICIRFVSVSVMIND